MENKEIGPAEYRQHVVSALTAMDVKTQLKIDVISKVSQGKTSIQNASKLLGKSPRTIERYLVAHRKKEFSTNKSKLKRITNKFFNETGF